MGLEEVRSDDGRTVAFLCSRGSGNELKPPTGKLWCPLRSRYGCSWAGVATDVAGHLAADHGRRYEAG